MPFNHLSRAVLSALVALTVPTIATAADFSQFRGPAGDGHAQASGLPITWNATDHVTWQVPIAGKGWSSPIVVGSHLYLTTAVAKEGGGQDDQSLRAICLDIKTGKMVWNQEVFDGNHVSTSGLLHSKNSHASPTPISDGKKLYVHFGT